MLGPPCLGFVTYPSVTEVPTLDTALLYTRRPANPVNGVAWHPTISTYDHVCAKVGRVKTCGSIDESSKNRTERPDRRLRNPAPATGWILVWNRGRGRRRWPPDAPLLCGEAERTLSAVLAGECGDDVLRNLLVASVSLADHGPAAGDGLPGGADGGRGRRAGAGPPGAGARPVTERGGGRPASAARPGPDVPRRGRPVRAAHRNFVVPARVADYTLLRGPWKKRRPRGDLSFALLAGGRIAPMPEARALECSANLSPRHMMSVCGCLAYRLRIHPFFWLLVVMLARFSVSAVAPADLSRMPSNGVEPYIHPIPGYPPARRPPADPRTPPLAWGIWGRDRPLSRRT